MRVSMAIEKVPALLVESDCHYFISELKTCKAAVDATFARNRTPESSVCVRAWYLPNRVAASLRSGV